MGCSCSCEGVVAPMVVVAVLPLLEAELTVWLVATKDKDSRACSRRTTQAILWIRQCNTCR